jgi:ubiquinone/menaquinone biosynthesis C-methylase UbiE
MADFSSIAPIYDLMTDFDSRLVKDFDVVKSLVEKFKIKSALDAGCGTGVHTIILARLGVDVVGIDASKEMLEQARLNAVAAGVNPRLRYEFYEALPDEWSGRFDAIFCLANSLPGVGNVPRLNLAVHSFHRVLKPGGKAIIQVLNFDHFRLNNRRIIKISGQKEFIFVRFLDLDEHDPRLNVIIINHVGTQIKHQFISESILPITAGLLTDAARAASFSDVAFYRDLSLHSPFGPEAENLIAVLTR